MAAEYTFDYSKSRPNPYAKRLRDTIAVVLDPDIAKVFRDSKQVNTFLRAAIAATERRKNRRAG